MMMMMMSNYKFYLMLSCLSNLTFAISDNPAAAAVAILIKNGD